MSPNIASELLKEAIKDREDQLRGLENKKKHLTREMTQLEQDIEYVRSYIEQATREHNKLNP